MKKYLLAFLGLSLNLLVMGIPGGKVMLSQNGEIYNLGRSVLYFVDHDHSYSIERISGKEAESLFKPSEHLYPNFGYSQSDFWLKIELVNLTGETWFLWVENPMLDSISLFGIKPSGITRSFSGDLMPFSQRDVKTNQFLFKLDLPKGVAQTYFLKISSHESINFSLKTGTLETVSKIIHRRGLGQGIYFGIFFLCVVINLFMYFLLRDRNSLYYVLYVLSIGLTIGSIYGLTFEFLWPRNYKMNYYLDIIRCLPGIFAIVFAASFLQTSQFVPRLHKFFYLFFAVYVALIISSLFHYDFIISKLIQITAFLNSIYIIIISLVVLKRGYKPAKFFLIAWSVFLVGVISFLLKNLNILPNNYFTHNSIQIGSGVEILLLSFAIADRLNIYKKEKEQAQRQALESMEKNRQFIMEQNKILDAKVIERTAEVNKQKEEIEKLIHNILPIEIAEELKSNGFIRAKKYEMVSVMFTDFKDFTKISQQLSPEELVNNIDYCYREFDNIILRYNLEKIKTIGDSYMCAAGIPSGREDTHSNIIRAAIEIRDFIERFKNEKISLQRPFFEIRVGIHSGPVVAGIVGSKKFAYDIWGDCVNTASRIEQKCLPGKINISGNTYDLVKGKFNCIYRGKISVKHKGEIEMYFVENEIKRSVCN